jgi:hypothetical protein
MSWELTSMHVVLKGFPLDHIVDVTSVASSEEQKLIATTVTFACVK